MRYRQLPEEQAYASVIVTDQGNGGWYCTKCGYHENITTPSKCPNCKRTLVYQEPWFSPGGSDF